jgi:ankyrin repeat protein
MIDLKHHPKKSLQAFKHLIKQNSDYALTFGIDNLPALRAQVEQQGQDLSLREVLSEWWACFPLLHTGPKLYIPKHELMDTSESHRLGINRVIAFLKDTIIETQWKNQTLGKFGGQKPLNLSWKTFYLDLDAQISAQSTDIDQMKWAAENGHENYLRRLLSQNPDLTYHLNRIFWPPIILQNFQSILLYLIDEGLSVESISSYDWTMLHWAIFSSKESLVRQLLNLGVHPNGPSVQHQTPLFLAAYKQNVPLITALLKVGADKYISDQDGFFPLSCAVYQGHIEVLQHLLDPYTLTLAKPIKPFGWSLLHVAAIKGFSEILSMLIQAGADIEAQDDFGRTPLHWACQLGHAPVVHSLIDAGVFINPEDKYGDTPLKVSALTHHNRLTHWLFQQGAR